MDKIFKYNSQYYLKILILSFVCVVIHLFWCNFGGIKHYFSHHNDSNLFKTILETTLYVIAISSFLSVLFSLNIFLTKIIVTIFNFIGAIYTYFVIHLGIILNEQIIISILFYLEENDVTSSFDCWVFAYTLTIFIIATLIIFYIEKILKIKSEWSLGFIKIKQIFLNNCCRFLFAIIFTILSALSFHKDIFLHAHKIKTLSEQIMPSYFLIKYQELGQLDQSTKNKTLKGYEEYGFINNNKSPLNNEPIIAIIIVGESLRSDRLGINGYYRNTTPKIAKIPNLFTFKDVLTCATSTSASLLCMLTDESQDNWMEKFSNLKNDKKYSVAKIFKDLGFNISVISSANKDYGINIYANFHSPDKIIMASELRKKYVSKINDHGDLLIVEELNNNVNQDHLYILGTRGSHREYYSNYPREYAVFKPDLGHSLENIANSYDNTVVYFDSFIDKIINKFKSQNAILFYVSDHGESLGENGVFLHGAPMDIAPPEQRRVPMIVWMSDKFIKSHKNQYQSLKNSHQLNRDNKLQVKHDHFFYTILGCMNIKSSKLKTDANLNLCE